MHSRPLLDVGRSGTPFLGVVELRGIADVAAGDFVLNTADLVLKQLPRHKERHMNPEANLRVSKGRPMVVLREVADQLGIVLVEDILVLAARNPRCVGHREVSSHVI